MSLKSKKIKLCINKNLMHNNILNGIEEVNRFVSIYIQVDYMSMKKPSIHNHK